MSTAGKIFRIAVDVLCCFAGLAILCYGLWLWSDYGFALPPSRWLRATRVVYDPGSGARWLVMLGFSIAAYFGFFLVSAYLIIPPHLRHLS